MHPKAWGTHPTKHKHNQRKHAASRRTSLCNDNCHGRIDCQSHSNARGLQSIALTHKNATLCRTSLRNDNCRGSVESSPHPNIREPPSTASYIKSDFARHIVMRRYSPRVIRLSADPISRGAIAERIKRIIAGFVRDIVKRQ